MRYWLPASGRPPATLVSSDEQRSFTEGPVDPHRVACSKSDLCSMSLRFAHGLGNKAVSAEIGALEQAIGKRRRHSRLRCFGRPSFS